MSVEGPKSYPVVFDPDLGLQYSYQSGYIVIPEASVNSITALTGDVTAAGPGTAAATLTTVNSNVGSFTNANITVNAKGLITAAANGTANTAVAVLAAATVGGAAQEEVAVAGLLTTSTILAVSQKTPGGAALPITGWTNVINGSLNLIYSADMGVGARVLVYFIP